ncbi:raffinose/stachyose/melibiose transport system substrate-binding protein [Cytobacillus eiseniae]|uniref:Raffinose/stachyose/melibiose transport system substrate-binding protein n=1 Tax=Cytobacillus eiseniae TaxID=762947 RepID=A0ABS4RLT5_9BACI|nr:ABC transporter substrate-binding protein [Cytobacillus eiseniae]MBP2242777.1 raffinose/stachyose/melibiose transport system substrate-binding protein [Cytobacillus eiseniae]
MKSKWRAGLFAVSLGLAGILTGCSSDEWSTSESKPKGEQVSLDIFQFKVEFKDQFEEVAKAYEKEHENVKINITTVGGGEDYGAALRSKFASGNEPAIYNIGGPQDVEDWKDKLADLSDTAAADVALEGTLDGVTVDGEVLGLPYNQEGYGFIYNKNVFAEAGIDPASIVDYASLETAVKELDSKKGELGLEAVFALPGKEKWVTGLHLSNTFLAPEFDNNVLKAFSAKEVEFQYGEAFKKILDLQNDYSVQPTVSLDYSQQVEELFSLQKVAIIQQGNWVYGSIASIDEEFAQNGIGILPIPVEGYEGDRIPVGIPMYWGVNSNADEAVVKEAKEFLDWLYTSETGKETVVSDFNFIPAYEGYDSTKIADPLSKDVYEYSEKGKTIGWTFMGYPTGWGENELGVEIQRYLSDEASWDDVINTTKKVWGSSR